MQSNIQRKYWQAVTRLLLNRQGQDLIEYALMTAFLTVAVAAFFPTSLAPNVTQIMSKVSSLLARAPN